MARDPVAALIQAIKRRARHADLLGDGRAGQMGVGDLPLDQLLDRLAAQMVLSPRLDRDVARAAQRGRQQLDQRTGKGAVMPVVQPRRVADQRLQEVAEHRSVGRPRDMAVQRAQAAQRGQHQVARHAGGDQVQVARFGPVAAPRVEEHDVAGPRDIEAAARPADQRAGQDMVEDDMVEPVGLHPLLAHMRHARQLPVEQQHMAKAPAGDAGPERPVQPHDIRAPGIEPMIMLERLVLGQSIAGKADFLLHLTRPIIRILSLPGRCPSAIDHKRIAMLCHNWFLPCAVGKNDPVPGITSWVTPISSRPPEKMLGR